jgi:hypothetical protein
MSFDLSRLGRGEWIVGAGSVALLASMLFLPWFGGSQTVDGWNGLTHFRWLAVATLALSLALLIFAASRRAPAIPVTLSLFVSVLGAASAAWLIYRVAIDPTAGRRVGGWIGLAGALAITYGGFIAMRRQGIAAGDAPAVIPTVDPWAEGHS